MPSNGTSSRTPLSLLNLIRSKQLQAASLIRSSQQIGEAIRRHGANRRNPRALFTACLGGKSSNSLGFLIFVGKDLF